tara:strand:- start:115 stop:966 length:852 start_codon:yes stop_codon:yes gene_type:complete
MSKCYGEGAFFNQVVRSYATHIIAEKYNLNIEYQNEENINKLGLILFKGTNLYSGENINVNDYNYFEILQKEKLIHNITTNRYYQTKKISDTIHDYLNKEYVMNKIIANNWFYKNRYNRNNDCFIHIRLGDVANWNPGFNYYDSILSSIDYTNIFIATDSPEHQIIKDLKNKYKKIILFGDDIDINTNITYQMFIKKLNNKDNNITYDTFFDKLIDIIKFGSTCKYVILSYGTFSAMIGYFSFYSQVYYKKFSKTHAWDWSKPDECDMFRDHSTKLGKWIEIP